MARSVNLSAPYQGISQDIPLAALQSPFAENILNFNVTQAGLSLRKGDSKRAGLALTSPWRLNAYGDSFLFLTAHNSSPSRMEIWNVDAGSLSYNTASSGFAYFYPNIYRNNLYLFATTTYAPGIVFNGSTWATIGYTGTGLAPIAGNNYKRRQYIIQSGEPAYWYSGIDATTGPLTKIDLIDQIETPTTLAAIASFTLADNLNAVEIQTFIFADGFVLFYEGSYPDSTSWRKVGQAQISSILDYNAYFKQQGDTLVLTDTGLVSLRELFLKGAQAALNLSVNTRVVETWSAIVKAARTAYTIPSGPLNGAGGGVFKGVWDSATNRIIVQFPLYFDDDGALTTGPFYFVYSTIYQSWTFHRSIGNEGFVVMDIARFKNTITTLGTNASVTMVWNKEGSTGYQDRNVSDNANVSYPYEMLSAPIPFPKTAVYETSTIEPILQSDLYAETNWQFISDFGKQESGEQKVSALTTAPQKPAANVGMGNITYVQVKMSGTTAANKTVGLDLYSYNVWYSSGEEGSR